VYDINQFYGFKLWLAKGLTFNIKEIIERTNSVRVHNPPLKLKIKYMNAIETTLTEIKHLLASNQTDYCDTAEAARIIAIPQRHLKVLHVKHGLPRYQRVKSYVYKKTDCYKYAALLDSNTITL
jgi:hypothetical protein